MRLRFTRGQVLRYAAQLAALAVALVAATWVASARIDDIIGERPAAMHRNPIGAWRTVNISSEVDKPHRVPFRVSEAKRVATLTPRKEAYSPMPRLQQNAEYVVVTGECRCGDPEPDVLTPIRALAGLERGEWQKASLPTDDFTELPNDGMAASFELGDKDSAGPDGVTRWREIYIVPKTSGPLVVEVSTDQIANEGGIGSQYHQEAWGPVP